MKEVSILKQRFPFAGLLMAAIAGILLSSWLGSSWLLFIGLSAVSLPLLLFWRKGGLCWVLTLTIFSLLQLWGRNIPSEAGRTPPD